MAVGMPEPRLGQVEQFLGELRKRGGLCAKSAGAVEISGAPTENPCRARSGAVWGLGGCHFELVAAHDDGRRCLNVR
jgi:hypothetical protein